MMISFIVPAFNEETELAATLKAIHASGSTVSANYEIIVADDASTDNTAAIAIEQNARLVSVKHRQIGATRNSGASVANGEVFIFVDADTRVNPGLIDSALKALGSGAVGGGARVRFDQPMPPFAAMITPLLVRAYLATGWAAGCFMFCRREAFEQTGGFDESLYGGEEIIFSKAMKKLGPFVILPESVNTSSRKMRMYSAREQLGTLFKLSIHGMDFLKKREYMSMWYDGRRE